MVSSTLWAQLWSTITLATPRGGQSRTSTKIPKSICCRQRTSHNSYGSRCQFYFYFYYRSQAGYYLIVFTMDIFKLYRQTSWSIILCTKSVRINCKNSPETGSSKSGKKEVLSLILSKVLTAGVKTKKKQGLIYLSKIRNKWYIIKNLTQKAHFYDCWEIGS